MDNIAVRGVDAWVERISEQELPALATTVRTLEKLEKDDAASLACLGRSVLHDHGLTSRILRVVNSVIYNRGRAQVTTVSRASVILGYDALKHICITATMMDGMLTNKDISKAVHDRLIRVMAQSLHAAMLARMLLGGYDEDTQEEVYIAALLHNLGEIAFWSMGGAITEALLAQLQQAGGNEKALVQDRLGTSFESLGAALAKAWNMGDMLVRSIRDPGRRTPELRCIALAHDFSRALADGDQGRIQEGLQAMAKFMVVEPDVAKARIQSCTQATAELASCYGAQEVAHLLDPRLGEDEDQPREPRFHEPDEALQLKMLREMTFLVGEGADINLLIHTTMEGLLRAVGMDRVVVLMPNPKFNQLSPRFYSSADDSQIKDVFSLPLGGDDIFTSTFKGQEGHWVDKPKSLHWAPRLPAAMATINQGSPFLLAPLVLDKKCLGLFYADRAHSGRALGKEDFESFSHFVRQASLCLMMILRG
ncbi:HDOD domain-containing protein [Gallaecimonas sp. GXIMD4217]|uniref:HDOD domain-containing protein n=1 Tax=Gallaecimonas sp. GXIMD4217 TaxID=3131927 RepID=UPI00311B30CA